MIFIDERSAEIVLRDFQKWAASIPAKEFYRLTIQKFAQVIWQRNNP